MQENITKRRVRRTRQKLKVVAPEGRLRLTVFRSASHIYAQVIDDKAGKTLASASTVDKQLSKSIKIGSNIEAAAKVGEELAKRAVKAGVKDVYFDRSGNRYHGRIKALADAARAAGLNF